MLVLEMTSPDGSSVFASVDFVAVRARERVLDGTAVNAADDDLIIVFLIVLCLPVGLGRHAY